MGESFRIVNLDKRQYFAGRELYVDTRFSDLQAEPLSGMLVWVLTKVARADEPAFRGSWDGDRVVIAGDESEHRDVYELADEFRDISVPLLEEWIDGDVFRAMEYWERGMVDDDGRYVPDGQAREEQAARRKDADYPLDKWEARLTRRRSGPPRRQAAQ